jgi:hypothetical protein
MARASLRKCTTTPSSCRSREKKQSEEIAPLLRVQDSRVDRLVQRAGECGGAHVKHGALLGLQGGQVGIDFREVQVAQQRVQIRQLRGGGRSPRLPTRSRSCKLLPEMQGMRGRLAQGLLPVKHTGRRMGCRGLVDRHNQADVVGW